MAWTEQCKVAFHANAKVGLLRERPNKDGRRPVAKVLRALSKESGIPFNTLKRWYYEMEEENASTKNDTGISVENNNESEPEEKVLPKNTLCLRCGDNPVFLTNRGKPLSSASKYYGLCNPCRHKSKKEEDEQKKIECPNCGHRFLP